MFSAVQKENRYKKSSGLGIFGLLIPFVFLILAVVGLFKFLPGVFSGNFARSDRFTLAVNGPKNFVVSISTKGKEAVVIVLPENLIIPNVAHGYGKYPVSKIYQVGELDHRGGEVYLDTLSDFLGIPIDGYVHTSTKFSSLKQYFFNLNFIFNTTSSLGFWDKIKFAQTAGSLRFDKINTVDLGKISEKINLADGQSARSLDVEIVDVKLGGVFSEESIANEELRVSVFNATEVSGLGEKAARVLGNIGVDVVNVDTGDLQRRKCVIRTAEKLVSSLTVLRIAAIFACNVEKSQDVGRSDLVVEVGQDFADRLLK